MSANNIAVSNVVLPSLTGDSGKDQQQVRHALLSMAANIQSVQNSSQGEIDKINNNSIESGKDGNTRWIKFPGGRMEVDTIVSAPTNTPTTVYFNRYFIDTTYVVVATLATTASIGAVVELPSYKYTNSCSVYQDCGTTQDVNVNIVGEWK